MSRLKPRVLVLFGLWIGVFAATLRWPADACAQDRVALVIGNAAYRNSALLASPRRDARDVSQTLRAAGFVVDVQIDLDRSGMLRALRKFSDVSKGAKVALLFYAGHGIQVPRRNGTENFLVPVDARLRESREVDDEAVSMRRVLDFMEDAASRIVILDACRDNPLAEQMRGTGASRGSMRGLAREEGTTRGTLLVFSTEPGAVAEDEGPAGNSPFAAALVRNLAQPGLEVRQMLTRVRAETYQFTRGRQTPWSNDGLLEDLFLVPAAAPPPPPAPPVPAPARPPAATAPAFDPRMLDFAFWSSVEKSRNPDDFLAYLHNFPSGVFAHIARSKLTELSPSPTRPLASVSVAPPAPAPTTVAPVADEDVAWTVARRRGARELLGFLGHPTGARPIAIATVLQRLRLDKAGDSVAAERLTASQTGIDGTAFNAQVRIAVRRWQAFEGLAETGMLTDALEARLKELANRQALLLGDVAATSPLGVALSSIAVASRYTRGWDAERPATGAPDFAEAVYWYRAAAVTGDGRGFTQLGLLAARGTGIRSGPDDAALLWRTAAALGEASAMVNLGLIHERGINVPADSVASRRWYERAAALNSPIAREALLRLPK